ncbi:MAG: hypothetical protein RIR26_2961 [Pseudomonadota bacterium]|jgi:NADP-dependent 3-hydroxy acid dehydrogenase YdfG
MLSEVIQSALRSRHHSLAGRTALVTGASSGIGLATAVRLALDGCHLNLVARRLSRLKELKSELLNLNPQLRIQCLELDLASDTACEVLEENKFFEAQILINNAGLAKGWDPVLQSSKSDWQAMIQTNISAAFQVSRMAAQHMAHSGGGDIVAISSVAAHTSYDNGAVYCATKHAFRAFHEALRLETLHQNLRVLLISPGMVNTEFSLVRFSGDSERAQNIYKGIESLDAGDIADCILFALSKPRHINIDDMVIKPQQQGNPWRVHRNPS